MFSKISKVFVTTYNIINRHTFGQGQKIQILDVTDRRFCLNSTIRKIANIINHFEEIETRFLGNKFVKLWSSNDSMYLIQQLLVDKNLNILAIQHLRQRRKLFADHERNPKVCIEQDFHSPYRTALTSAAISSSVITGDVGQDLIKFSIDARRGRTFQPILANNSSIRLKSRGGIETT